ncbi:MAG: DUF4168 domain-containing protein [Alphaproteobacteria bacterium]|nr:DUF4168 domain-containing protein [Alphaproteobacteria bacterium]
MSIERDISPFRQAAVMIVFVLAGLVAGLNSPVYGQSFDQTEPEIERQYGYISDTKLNLFISAQKAVEDIQTRYTEAANDPARAAEIEATQRSMTEEIVRTIKAHALTVEEYNNILAAIQQTDTEVSKRYYDLTRTE